MELRIIPFDEVEMAINEARENWTETDQFNTHAHSHDEITHRIPETQSLKHRKPTLYTSLYQYWASLIMNIHGVSDWHIFEIPRLLAQEIMDSYMVWCARGQLDGTSVQELASQFPKHSRGGTSTESILTGKEWFLRLEFCSTKDGEKGAAPVQSVEDIIRALCTSARARRALLDDLEEYADYKPKIFLVPYNDVMNPQREFRIFCPPPVGKIACISQYRWTSPFPIDSQEELQQLATRILQDVEVIHVRIMQHAGSLKDVIILKTMQDEGFTFDAI